MSQPKPIVILMADDDADDRLLAQDALAECRLANDLHTVENGEELLDYLQRRGKFANSARSSSRSTISRRSRIDFASRCDIAALPPLSPPLEPTQKNSQILAISPRIRSAFSPKLQ